MWTAFLRLVALIKPTAGKSQRRKNLRPDIIMAHVGADKLRLSALGAELLSKFLAGLAVAS